MSCRQIVGISRLNFFTSDGFSISPSSRPLSPITGDSSSTLSAFFCRSQKALAAVFSDPTDASILSIDSIYAGVFIARKSSPNATLPIGIPSTRCLPFLNLYFRPLTLKTVFVSRPLLSNIKEPGSPWPIPPPYHRPFFASRPISFRPQVKNITHLTLS